MLKCKLLSEIRYKHRAPRLISRGWEEEMYVNTETLINAGKILTGLTAFFTIVWKLFQWINHQKEQDEKIKSIRREYKEEIKRLEDKHDREVEEMRQSSEESTSSFQEELTMITYGLLACLQGLNEQGCDGPVSEAIDKFNKYLNKKAHHQQ